VIVLGDRIQDDPGDGSGAGLHPFQIPWNQVRLRGQAAAPPVALAETYRRCRDRAAPVRTDASSGQLRLAVLQRLVFRYGVWPGTRVPGRAEADRGPRGWAVHELHCRRRRHEIGGRVLAEGRRVSILDAVLRG